MQIDPGKTNPIVRRRNRGKTKSLKTIDLAINGYPDDSLVALGDDQAEAVVELPIANIRYQLSREGRVPSPQSNLVMP